MTRDQLADALTGVEHGRGIGPGLEADAKRAGLVVVFGAGDDLMVFRGAIHGEAEAGGGGVACIDAEGLFPAWDELDTGDVDAARSWFRREQRRRARVEAVWCGEGGYLWTFRTDVPHATFEMVEDGEPCCRGLVLALADLVDAPDPATQAEWRLARALQWSGLTAPAMLAIPEDGRITGWVITTYNEGAVEKAWSGPLTHQRGAHEGPGQVRPGGIRLYGSERDAWIALRIAKERQFAMALASLDAQIDARAPSPSGAPEGD